VFITSFEKPLILVLATASFAGCATAPETPEKTATTTSPSTTMPTRTAPGVPGTVEPGTGVPESAIELLEQREGSRNIVYVGHNGKLTAGVGHVLDGAERQQYPLGARVPENVIQRWLEADSEGSWDAAVEQANTIKDARLAEPLFAVNYQLGVNWYSIHKNTWALLMKHDWDGVSVEIMNSRWCNQTPVRCNDFERALQAL
jgi:GH24 family phage-related lysozyme (muramidase)